MWAEDKYHLPSEIECHCDLYELFIKLASIMEKKELFTETTMRDIQVPKQPRIDWNSYAIGNTSVRWTQKGDLIPLSRYEYDKQCNTETSLRNLIWKIPDGYVSYSSRSNW